MSAELNKAIVRRFYEEVFNQRNLNLIKEFVGDDFVNHDLTPIAPTNKISLKLLIKGLTKAFPDHYHSIEDLIATGDKVVMRCTLTGTHKGKFPGYLEMPPTGKLIRQTQIHILRIQAEKIVEHWSVRDDLTLLQQLGVILPSE